MGRTKSTDRKGKGKSSSKLVNKYERKYKNLIPKFVILEKNYGRLTKELKELKDLYAESWQYSKLSFEEDRLKKKIEIGRKRREAERKNRINLQYDRKSQHYYMIKILGLMDLKHYEIEENTCEEVYELMNEFIENNPLVFKICKKIFKNNIRESDYEKFTKKFKAIRFDYEKDQRWLLDPFDDFLGVLESFEDLELTNSYFIDTHVKNYISENKQYYPVLKDFENQL